MSETTSRTYTGGCHCGAVRYRVTMDLAGAITCNCSMCSKTGAVITFVPADQFVLLSGEDVLADYQFNKKIIHHHFCTRCGIRSFARGIGRDGGEIRAINVRCLDGVDVDSVPITKYDGRSA